MEVSNVAPSRERTCLMHRRAGCGVGRVISNWLRVFRLGLYLVGLGVAGQGLGGEALRVLLVTGMDYPAHLWRETWPVLASALRGGEGVEVYTIEDPHFLDSAALLRYDVLVMHWQNWEQPGPGEAARSNLRKYVEGGGGVALVHFACGAWHGEWGGYGDVAGRVWFGSGPGKVQHDPYGPFTVRIVGGGHPVVEGMEDFETTDELYTCLEGDRPIEVLAEATSKVTGQVHPMAFVSRLGKGRTFHCTLGHDVAALRVPAVQELYRRGVIWAGGGDTDTRTH